MHAMFHYHKLHIYVGYDDAASRSGPQARTVSHCPGLQRCSADVVVRGQFRVTGVDPQALVQR
jgi:hypothetical protein